MAAFVHAGDQMLATPVVHSRDINETFLAIDQINLDNVYQKLVNETLISGYGWQHEEAKKTIKEYKEFLKRNAVHFFERKLTPESHDNLLMRDTLNKSHLEDVTSPQVDIVWHTHILFSRQYFQDCENIFGFYFHHTPDVARIDAELMNKNDGADITNNLELIASKIDTLPILSKLTSPGTEGGYEWPVDLAKIAIKDYLLFLDTVLNNINGLNDLYLEKVIQQITPKINLSLQVIDITWRTHILFTRKYFFDCQKLFGSYFHHSDLLETTC